MADQEKESRLQRRIKKREERETVVAAQRDQFRKRERNKKIFNYAIGIVILIAVIYAVYVATKKDDGQYDAFAKCLTSKGVVMYGTDWCPHCQAQKRLFGDSFRYVTFINCDVQKAACDAAGVQGYPTWTFPRGEPVSGEQQLSTLSARTDCAVQ
jgi:hypothetical protein